MRCSSARACVAPCGTGSLKTVGQCASLRMSSDVETNRLGDWHVPRLATVLVRGAVLGMLATAWLPPQTYAQGGPPLLTDDPDTPGPGFWEINLATVIDETSGRRHVEV